MYDKVIGQELMRICVDANFFFRLGESMKEIEYRTSSSEIDLLISFVTFFRYLINT